MIGLIKGTARQAKTVSGLPLPIASYKSNSKLPIQELSLSINPTQSGSGDPAPDNIRPITGVSSVNVARTGVNIASDITVRKPATVYSGSWLLAVKFPCDIPANTTINLSFVATATSKLMTNTTYVTYMNIDATGVRQNFTLVTKQKFTANTDYSLIMSRVNNNITTDFDDVMVEIGSTASDYSAYQGNTYLIQLGDTYYGATLDVVRGKLVVDRGYANLGDVNWSATSTYFYTQAFESGTYRKANGTTNIICENYKTSTSADMAISGFSTSGRVRIYDSSHSLSDADTFKSDMAGVHIVYELATPIEIDLTPTQINTLLGSNNIWHDGNGDVEVLKFMDRQLYFGR